MRRFRVWAHCVASRCTTREPPVVLEFDDDVTDEEVEQECSEVVNTLLESVVESGWDELKEGGGP